jgi:hypothetical protein
VGDSGVEDGAGVLRQGDIGPDEHLPETGPPARPIVQCVPLGSIEVDGGTEAPGRSPVNDLTAIEPDHLNEHLEVVESGRRVRVGDEAVTGGGIVEGVRGVQLLDIVHVGDQGIP